jgi:hypothetical protein
MPFDSQTSRGARTRLVKSWVREVAGVDEDATIMVSELACREPGCPPLEVVMAILRPDQPPVQRKIHKALDELEADDVRAAWAGEGVGHHHVREKG